MTAWFPRALLAVLCSLWLAAGFAWAAPPAKQPRTSPVGWAAAGTAAASEARLPEPVRGFFENYCHECHDNATAKARLSLETLPAVFESDAWVKVHDRLASGEMPPRDETQPSAQERAQVVRWLSQQLTASLAARHAREGRVPLRRMNRREYEATLHDLLGIALPLENLLPQDNSVHGFDTVSRGLETSAAHLLSYQRAADAAIDEALPRMPISFTVTRWTGRQYLEGRLPVHRKGIDPFVRVDGDALVMHAATFGDMSMQAPHPPIPGRYRIRAAARVVNNEGRPMSVLIGKRVDRFQTEKLLHVVDIQDIPAGKTKVLEVETDLGFSQQNQFIYFEPLDLLRHLEFAKGRGDKGSTPLESDFAGPGVAFEWAELEGPLDADLGVRRMLGDLPRLPRMADGKPLPPNWQNWPPRGGEYLAHPLAAQSTDPAGDAQRILRSFLPLALRRPTSDQELAHYAAVVQEELDQGSTFDEAMRAACKAILCSSDFLVYVERPGRLDDFAVASRLARFLWSSFPDQELFDAAARGTLTRKDVLLAQTERMLRDPKAARFARGFVDQWLDLGKFLDMKPDDLYAEYDLLLGWSMQMETRRFFDEMLTADLPTMSFVDSNWTFLNARLAAHYGIAGVTGWELHKTAVQPADHRGGVITQASVLKLTTNASYTSPVKRGAWVLERILGTPPPPPPPDVKAVEPDIRGATTIREQLARHKDVAVCASCHAKIDPPGFALENYDVVGGWRERYRVKQSGPGNDFVPLSCYPARKVWLAKPVEADGETAGGRKFRDIGQYKQIVLEDPDQLTRNLAEKLIIYATGAEIDFADRAAVEKIVQTVRAKNHGFRSLVHAVIQSPLFLNK